MSKVLVILSKRHEEILKISLAVQSLNFDCRIFFADEFAECHSYLKKKLDELLNHKLSVKHLKNLGDRAIKEISDYKPDKILFINEPLTSEAIQKIISGGIPCYFYYVDPIENVEHFKNRPANCFMGFYDINSYEKLHRLGVKNIKFLPLGYNCDYENISKATKDIDIFWVGTPGKARLKILSATAEKSRDKGWIFQCYSPFWGWEYFWKKQIFRIKYPALYRCAVNRGLSSKEVAEKYSRSKICLNIHNSNIDSFNPRAYEILATGGFLLTDARKNYDGLIPGEDLVCYSSVEEMIEKIEYYLFHDDEREKIADCGRKKVTGRRTAAAGVGQLLDMK